MDKSKKLIIFYLSSLACRDYSLYMIERFQKLNPQVFVNKSNKGFIQNATEYFLVPKNKISILFYGIYFYFKILLYLVRQKRSYASLIIYCPAFHPLNYIIALISKQLNLKFILTVHDYTTHLGEKNKLLEYIQKKTIALSFYSIFLSKIELQKASEDGFVSEKLKLLAHPLYIFKQSHSLSHNRQLKILFLGRVLKYKGISTFAHFFSENSAYNLTIAGKGDYSEIDCSKTNIRCIKKWHSSEEIERLILENHLLVLPYKEASQSGILALGFSYEIPMLISKIEGLQEQISMKSAVFFDKDMSQMQVEIERIATSADLYNKLRQNMKVEKKERLSQWNLCFNKLLSELGIY